MIDRRTFLGGLAGGLLAAPLAAANQVYRVGVIFSGFSGSGGLSEASLAQLRELGYVPGQNIVIEQRFAEGKVERYEAAATEFVRMKVDVISVGSTPGAQAAQRVTSTVPIVFNSVADPVGAGLVNSLARPGGNVTGFTHVTKEVHAKRLELLKQLIPNVSRIAVLAGSSRAITLPDTEVAARALGLKVDVFQANSPSELEDAFSKAVKGGAQGLVALPDQFFWAHRERIGELASMRGLPTVFEQKGYVEAGGLLSYGANLKEQSRRTAILIDRILKGAKPAELPVEQPTKFELVINLKTAKALGLTIPPSLLARADQVIE